MAIQLRKAERSQTFIKMAVQGPSGSGKAQPLYSKILTPTGWSTMGDMKVGTEIIGSDGKPQKVLAVYPQGKKDIYQVVFSDGTSTKCCKEHLWTVQTKLDRAAGRKGMTVDTEYLRNRIKFTTTKKPPKYFIPIISPVEHEEKDYLIHPYVMGCLLGDGTFRSSGLTITNSNENIINAIRKIVEEKNVMVKRIETKPFNTYMLTTEGKGNIFIDELRRLGLWGKKSIHKFIPEEYLRGSIEQRTQLLQGLCDTDGYCGGYSVEYSTSSFKLAKCFAEIVQSLGGVCNINERMPKYTYKGEIKIGHKSYRLTPKLPNQILPFLYAENKLEKFIPKTKYEPARYIVSIEKISHEEAQCIKVSNLDSLYITDNHIVTHNTLSSLLLAKGLVDSWDQIAIIDTENGSADLYAHLGDYNVITLEPEYTPQKYIEAMEACEAAGIKVCIIDSITHSWEYLLKYHSSMSGNSFTNWGKVTPIQNQFIQKILQSKMHVISTIRVKQDYVLQSVNGKMVPQKVGLKSVQRDGVDYEFTVVFDLALNHHATASKDRTGLFMDQMEFIIDEDTGKKIKSWCNQGTTIDDVCKMIKACDSIDKLTSIYKKYPKFQKELSKQMEAQAKIIKEKEE